MLRRDLPKVVPDGCLSRQAGRPGPESVANVESEDTICNLILWAQVYGGTIRPGYSELTGEPLDIVSAFQSYGASICCMYFVPFVRQHAGLGSGALILTLYSPAVETGAAM